MKAWLYCILPLGLAACSGSDSDNLSNNLDNSRGDQSPDSGDTASDAGLEPGPQVLEPASDGGLGSTDDAGEDSDEGLDAALPSDAGQPNDSAIPELDASGDTDASDAEPSDAATTILIDFEDLTSFPSGSVGAAIPEASRLATLTGAGYSLRFSSLADYVAVVTLGQGHATSGVRGIGGVAASGGLSYGAEIHVRFFQPGGAPGSTRLVRLRGDQNAVNNVATLVAYDVNDVEIGTAQAADVAGGLTLEFAKAGIHHIKVTENAPNIAYDDLEFAPVQ